MPMKTKKKKLWNNLNCRLSGGLMAAYFLENCFLMISVFSSFQKAVSNICKDAGEFSIFFIFMIVFPLKIFWFKWFEHMINLINFLKIGR